MPSPLIKDLTSKQLKVALQTWHTPERKHLLSSQAGPPRTPCLSWFPQPSERALPLSSHTDPHIYNHTPAATETSLSLGRRPGPLHHLTPPLSTCSTVPVWSLYCWEDCSCLVIPASEPVERKGGMEGWEGGQSWREGGRRHLRCSHKAATVGTLTEASVIPCLHTSTCCPSPSLFPSSSFVSSHFLATFLPFWMFWWLCGALGRLL